MAALVVTILYVVYQYQRFVQIKNERDTVMGSKKIHNGAIQRFLSKYTQKGYNLILRIPVIRSIMLQIRKKLETLSVYDEFSLRKEVMKIMYSIFVVAVVVLVVLVVVQPSWLIIFWVFVGLLLTSGILIDFFIYRVEIKLLQQLKDYINRNRFAYQETKMVDEALFDALQYVGPEMKVHAERIYNILNSENPEEELAKYDDVAPTRYLRVFAGLTLLVKDRGDKFDKEKGSLYLKGLTAINEELNEELLFRSRLSYALRSITVLAIIPIFFAVPVKNYTMSSFPTSEAFYSSRFGFLAEISVYFISIACYLIVRKMRQVSDGSSELSSSKFKWEQAIFTKFPFVEKICIAMSPKEYTKKFNERRLLIKEANEQITVQQLTLRQIITSISIFIILVGSLAYAHVREAESTLNKNDMMQSLFTSNYTEKEMKMVEEQTEYDKQLINDFQTIKVLPSEEEIMLMIADQLNANVNDVEVRKTYSRVMEKWNVISNSYVKWWEIVFALALAYAFYQVPIIMLRYKRKARLKMMEREVFQLLVLISSLKDFDGMSVSVILEWMERFSIAFKRSLLVAIEEFDSGPEEALDVLSETNTFEPFQQIVARLKLTLERLSITEAFDDIDVERTYFLAQRKEEQNREVGSKTRIGDFLGLAPIVSLVFIYLIFPIMYIAVKESQIMMQLWDIR